MDIKQENILREEFEIWSNHPVTTLLLRSLANFKTSYVDKLSSASTDVSIPNEMFRLYAYGIKTIESVNKMATDYEVMLSTLNK